MGLIHLEKIYIKMSEDFIGDWEEHYSAEFLGAFDREGYEKDIMSYYDKAKAYINNELTRYEQQLVANETKMKAYSVFKGTDTQVNFDAEVQFLENNNKQLSRQIKELTEALKNKFSTILYYLPTEHIVYQVGTINGLFKYCTEDTEAEYAKELEELKWRLMS